MNAEDTMSSLTLLDQMKIWHTNACTVCKEMFYSHQGWLRDMCTPCRIDNVELQTQAVLSSLSRSVDKIASKTLTVEQWVSTLKYFNGRCAYCRIKHYACLEHFIPIRLGGGTSASNIVPGCLSCNALKRNIHPALVTTIPQKDIDRVRTYLMRFFEF